MSTPQLQAISQTSIDYTLSALYQLFAGTIAQAIINNDGEGSGLDADTLRTLTPQQLFTQLALGTFPNFCIGINGGVHMFWNTNRSAFVIAVGYKMVENYDTNVTWFNQLVGDGVTTSGWSCEYRGSATRRAVRHSFNHVLDVVPTMSLQEVSKQGAFELYDKGIRVHTRVFGSTIQTYQTQVSDAYEYITVEGDILWNGTRVPVSKTTYQKPVSQTTVQVINAGNAWFRIILGTSNVQIDIEPDGYDVAFNLSFSVLHFQ